MGLLWQISGLSLNKTMTCDYTLLPRTVLSGRTAGGRFHSRTSSPRHVGKTRRAQPANWAASGSQHAAAMPYALWTFAALARCKATDKRQAHFCKSMDGMTPKSVQSGSAVIWASLRRRSTASLPKAPNVVIPGLSRFDGRFHEAERARECSKELCSLSGSRFRRCRFWGQGWP